MIPEIIGAVGSLLSTGLGVASNSARDDRMLAQKEQDKRYNDPAAAAARLRSAGFSPSLVGLDGAGTSQPVDLSSNADLYQNAGNQLANLAQGYASRELDSRGLDIQQQKVNADIKHQERMDSLNRDIFDLQSLETGAKVAGMKADTRRKELENSQNLRALVYYDAVRGINRSSDLSPEEQQEYDKVLKEINVNSTEYKIARRAFETTDNEDEARSIIAKETKKIENDNPRSILFDVDRRYLTVKRQYELQGMHLSNEKIRIDNDFNSEANPWRSQGLKVDALSKTTDLERRNDAFQRNEEDIERLENMLNSASWLAKNFGKDESIARIALQRCYTLRTQMSSGFKMDYSTPLPYVGEFSSGAQGLMGALGGLALKKGL